MLISESGHLSLQLIPCDGLSTSGQLIDKPVSKLFFLFFGEVLPLYEMVVGDWSLVECDGMVGGKSGGTGNSDKGNILEDFHL